MSTLASLEMGRVVGGARCLLALALVALLTGCQVTLYSHLSEQQANSIVAALAEANIQSSKDTPDDKTWRINVSESDLAPAIDVLRAHGLPSDTFVSLGDVFKKQGLVSTPSEERMRYIYAVSQELSKTLLKVDGVIAARVHVTVPANDPLSDTVRPSSAAVFIKHTPDVDLRVVVPAVKDLVAHSIEGLTHDNVSLSLFEARPSRVHSQVAAAPAANSVNGKLRFWGIVATLITVALAIAALLPGFIQRYRTRLATLPRKKKRRDGPTQSTAAAAPTLVTTPETST